MGNAAGRRVVGVVGGGPLRLLLGEENRRKGLPCDLVGLDPVAGGPALKYLRNQIVAGLEDPAAIARLAEQSDVVTVLGAPVPRETLEALDGLRGPVHPSSGTLRTLRDPLVQKTFLRSRGLPVPEFRGIEGSEDLLASVRDFGFPSLFRANRDLAGGGADRVLASIDQVAAALIAANGHALMLERPVDLARELSVVAVRSPSGEIKTYAPAELFRPEPGVEMCVVPARIEAAAARAAEDLARAALEALQGVGVFEIGLWIDPKGALLLRELAAGVQASGSFTIEASRTSQFEQHLRAITGLPLGETRLLYSAVTMELRGAPGLHGPFVLGGVDAVREIPGVFVHLYGVPEAAPGRLLGHLTLIDVDDAGYRDVLVHRADQVRRMILQKGASS